MMNRNEILSFAALFIGVTALVVALGWFVLVKMPADHADWQRRALAAERYDYLQFPEGWTPVDCESVRATYGTCKWVCVNAEDVYRYCEPIIVPAEGDEQ